MARVTVVRKWPTGDVVQVTVAVDSSYPDALSQARAEAHREFVEAVAATVEDGE